MNVTTIGIDLAKNTFSVHGVDAYGKVTLRKTVSRGKLLERLAQLPKCLIGLGACGGAHQLARQLQGLGHDVRLMAGKFVTPYRKNQKNDGNDAEAICEAVARPNMRFVPIKTVEQQAVLAVHRIRQEMVAARTALINQLRGLLAEFGVLMPKGRFKARANVGAALEDERVPALAREVLSELDERIKTIDQALSSQRSDRGQWLPSRRAAQGYSAGLRQGRGRHRSAGVRCHSCAKPPASNPRTISAFTNIPTGFG